MPNKFIFIYFVYFRYQQVILIIIYIYKYIYDNRLQFTFLKFYNNPTYFYVSVSHEPLHIILSFEKHRHTTKFPIPKVLIIKLKKIHYHITNK